MNAKTGVNLKINLDKIPEDRIFKGRKGRYIDLTVFIDPNEQDEYGNNGGIKVAKNKNDSQEAAKKLPYVGNAKVFWTADSCEAQGSANPAAQDSLPSDFDDNSPPF